MALRREILCRACVFTVAVAIAADQAQAASGTWTNPASGQLWSTNDNWFAGTVADGSGATADFGTLDIDTNTTIHLDSPRTIGNLVFGDTVIGTPGGWMLDNYGAAANILTLEGGAPAVTVGPLGEGRQVMISATVGGSAGLAKSGEGNLTLAGLAQYTGQTTINGGTLTLAAANHTLVVNQPLQVNGGGVLDLRANRQYAGQFSSSTTVEGTGGLITGSGGALTVNQETTATFAGAIQGSVSMVKGGRATLAMTSPSSVTGSVAVIGWLSSLRERNNASDLGYGLTLKDGGSLSNIVEIAVRHATLNLDNNGTRGMADRVNDSAPIMLDNGTIRCVGRSGSNSTETVGAVAASGFASITMIAGSSASTVLTLAGLTRSPGAVIVFNRSYALGQTGNNPRVLLAGDDTSGLTFTNGTIVGMCSYNDNDKYFPVSYVSGVGFGRMGQSGFPNHYMPGADGNGFSGGNTLTNATETNDFITGASQVVRAGGQTINSLGIQGSGFGTCTIPLTFVNSNDTLTIASGWLCMWFQQTQIGVATNRGAITSGQRELFLLGGFQGAWGDSGNVNTIHSVVKDNGTNQVKFVLNLGRHTYLTANNTYSGGTFVNGMLARENGTLFPNNLYLQGDPGSVAIPDATNSVDGLVITGANVEMLVNSGQIGSNNIVTLNGGSTLTMVGDNTLSGIVFNSNGGTETPTINPGGVLTLIGDLSSTPVNPTVTPVINGGTLDLCGETRRFAIQALPDGNSVNGQTPLVGLNISSVIRNGGVTKRGGGVLELSGGNTFAGQLTVESGVLMVGSVNDSGSSGVLGNSGLPVILGSTNGVTNITGVLEYAGGDAATSKPFTMAAGGTGAFQVDSAATSLTLSGLIDGDGGLLKTGAGTLVLSCNNTYTGGTAISGGTLSISSDDNLGAVPGVFEPAGILIDNGGTLALTADIALAENRGITLGSSGVQVITAVGGTTDPVLGAISGSGSVDFIGTSGDFRLGRANDYTGDTRLFGSVKLTPGGENAFQFSTVTASPGNSIFLYDAAGTATFGGIAGSFDLPLQTVSGADPVALCVGNNDRSTTYGGVLSGDGSLTKIGAGTLILSGNNTYAGATAVSNGVLMGITGGSCSNSAVTVADGATNGVRILADDGVWTCSNLTYAVGTASVEFAFSVVPRSTTAPIKVNGNLLFDGTPNVIVRAPGLVISVGIYPLISYSGTLSGAPPTNAFILPGGLTATVTNNIAGKSIDLNVTVGNEVRWGVGDDIWDIYGAFNWKDTSDVAVRYVDGAAVRFDDSASGGSPILVTLDSIVNPACMTASNTAKNYTISGGGSIGGAARLNKLGAGILTLATTNAYAGGTTVSDGVLALTGIGRLSQTGPVLVNGGTLDIGLVSSPAGVVTLSAGNIAGTGGVLSGACYKVSNVTGTTTVSAVLGGVGFLMKSGAGTVILTGVNTYSGATTVNGGVLSVGSLANGGSSSGIGTSSSAAANLVLAGGTLRYTGGTVSINRNFTLSEGTMSTIEIADAGATLTVSGAAPAGGGLIKTGPGTLVLSGTNTYTGATVINGGVLQVGAGGATGTLGTGPVTNNAALVFNRTNSIYTFAGSIEGTGAVTKSGGGTLVFAGVNTYSGDTIVTGGTLDISSAFLADEAGVYLTNSAKLNLNFAGVDRIGYLYFEGRPQIQGYWGAPGSGAVNTNGTYLGGSGILLVTRGPPPPGTTVIVR